MRKVSRKIPPGEISGFEIELLNREFNFGKRKCLVEYVGVDMYECYRNGIRIYRIRSRSYALRCVGMRCSEAMTACRRICIRLLAVLYGNRSTCGSMSSV